MKFKVGDKVRIKKDLIVDNKYGRYKFITQMKPYLGTTQIIQNINYFNDGYIFKNNLYTWTDEMLEPIEENYNIKVIGNTVIVKTEDGNYTGVAKCSPEDTFDLATGVKLAIERLQKSPKIPTYNTEKNLWEVIVDGRKEEGSLEYVASEFIQDNLYYPFEYRKDKPEGWADHVHSFEEVIKYAIEYPNTFSVGGYKKYYSKYYSKQQIDFLNKLVQKLREVV